MAINVTFTFNGGSEFGPRDGWQVKLVGGTGDASWTSTANLSLRAISTTPVNNIFFEPTVYGVALNNTSVRFAPNTPSPPVYVYNDPEVSGTQRSNYINYRSSSNWSVHPSTGFSFDLWFAQSTIPSTNQNYANSWSWGTVNNGTYNLRTDKYTVFYQYDTQTAASNTVVGPVAWGWQKGGTVNIVCTLDNF